MGSHLAVSNRSRPDQGLYSVKDVARIISFSGKPLEVEKILRQARHWTANGMLSPVDDPHQGTGKSRLYDDFGIRTAAVLLELTRNGVAVNDLERVEEYLADCRNSPRWKEALSGKRNVIIQFSITPDDDPMGSVRTMRLLAASGPYKDVFWNNSTGLGKRGRRSLGPPYGSTILLNLTNIFARLAF